MGYKAAFFFFVLVTSGVYAAETRMFTLQNRPADSLVNTISPLLDEDGRVVADGNRLIIRASDEQLRQIDALIPRLDQPLRQYLVHIRRDAPNASSGSSIRYGRSDGSGTITRSSRDGGNTRTVTVQRSTRGMLDQASQQVRVLEGRRAWISAGEAVPYRSQDAFGRPNVEFRDVVQGFYLTLSPSGEQVMVDVETVNDNRQAGSRAIQTENLVTSMRVRPGAWVQLGGIGQREDSRAQTLRGSTRQLNREHVSLWIKVETLVGR